METVSFQLLFLYVLHIVKPLHRSTVCMYVWQLMLARYWSTI